MATIQSKGFNSARLQNGSCDAYRYIPIASGYASNIGDGDPVQLSSGTVVLGANGGTIVGVFRGCFYIDPVTKRPVESKNFVAGTTPTEAMNGETRPVARVELIQDKTFVIRASTSLANTTIGNLYAVTSIGSPDAQGNSTCQLDSSTTVALGSSMVQVVGLYKEPGNNWGDTNTAVEVVFTIKGLI